MANTVALITGATSGIGRETALFFARQRIRVAAVGRNEQAGVSLVDEIRDQGGNAIFINADVSFKCC